VYVWFLEVDGVPVPAGLSLSPAPPGQTVIDSVELQAPAGGFAGKAYRLLHSAAEHFHL
jgi:hypothetical protein